MDRRVARQLLTGWFEAGLDAVDPESAVAANFQPTAGVNPTVLALGKAAPAMVRGLARAQGRPISGVAVSNHPGEVPSGVELLIGGHPIPNEASHVAGQRLLERAAALEADDVAVVLISGGGSALAEVPRPGLTMSDLAETNRLLLRSGADIVQTNTIRRRLSLLKGGGLAAAIAPAALITLIISDVVGDPIEAIASGPTVATTDTAAAAEAVVGALDIADALPEAVLAELREPPPPRPSLVSQEIKVIAGGAVAAHAAAAEAERSGFPATVVDTRLDGDVIEVVGEVLDRSPGSFSVFAGETTVNVQGDGVGGRNQEAALLMATLIEGRSDVFFLAAGTDGIDGTSPGAGAFVDGSTMARARAQGISAAAALENNDSGSFFAALGDQLVTGPTGTNVGDLWMVLRAR